MVTEKECIEALEEAAERLGHSPSRAEYEELDITPSASTILRHCGSWNEAKEQAGLKTTAAKGGSSIIPKPDDVNLPDGVEWDELSQDQRWHYRNREQNTRRSLERRTRLRSWVSDIKSNRGCDDCGMTDARCLDFHHRSDAQKWMDISTMVTFGYGKEKLRAEIEKCDVLCANCHRRHHADELDDIAWTATDATNPGAVSGSLTPSDLPGGYRRRRMWVSKYKQERGCARCGTTAAACLSFHHTDEHKKALTVSQLVIRSHCNESVVAEIEKCELLCANCHRREHHEDSAISDGP